MDCLYDWTKATALGLSNLKKDDKSLHLIFQFYVSSKCILCTYQRWTKMFGEFRHFDMVDVFVHRQFCSAS